MEMSRAQGKRTLMEEEEEEDEDTVELGLAEDERKKAAASKKGSGGAGSTPPCCQVDNCPSDMSDAKKYHKRHRVCEHHAKAPVVLIAGIQERFCQQCSSGRMKPFPPPFISPHDGASAGSMRYQSSMTQRGAAGSAWLDTTSAAAKAPQSPLRDKASADKGKTPYLKEKPTRTRVG